MLERHAQFWAKKSNQTEDDALTALWFLRGFFKECSLPIKELLEADSTLQQRIGLVKQRANHVAAHLTLEPFELDIRDLMHFTAALVVLGEIVRSFHLPSTSADYFSSVDAASFQAAKRVFPQIEGFQLFSAWNLDRQARMYWQMADQHGIHLLMNELINILGGPPKDWSQ